MSDPAPLTLEDGEEIVAEGLAPSRLEAGFRSITITRLPDPAGGTWVRRWGRKIYPDGWRLLETHHTAAEE